MKKLLVSLLTLTMLAGCGGSKDSSKDQAQTGYVFKGNNVEITVGTKADDTLKALGEPLKKDVSKSCGGVAGDDIRYQYADFKVITFKAEKDQAETITEVSLLTDTVKTEEGVEIGSTKEDVEKAYGTDYKENGSEMVYSKGDMTISFILDSSKNVSNIYYRTNQEF